MHQHHNHHSPVDTGFNSFFDMWSPDVLLFTLLLAVLYFLLTGPWRSRFANAAPVSGKQKAVFVLALVFFYAAQGSPINYYGHEYLFSAHMFQQSLLYFIVPPMILIGLPEWFLHFVFRPVFMKKLLRAFTQPVIAALTFNALFSFYHIPFIFDAAAENHVWMSVYHMVLIIAAFMMWWPIVSPISEVGQLAGLRKVAYIFANGVLITPACALIIFANDLLYSTYSQVPEVLAGHTALVDQRLGGILMKLIQEFVYGSILAYVFYHWYQNERQTDLPMDQQPELPQAGVLAPAMADSKNRA
ncbi:cytochrome c oxidase assembly protein [Brevibacillus sp. H7]|uniref:cytochrome c oxidase assembly protein n=1 Tax=Brevibacillus sp. H7 TaxID=3349138 RepID=UPI0038181207